MLSKTPNWLLFSRIKMYSLNRYFFNLREIRKLILSVSFLFVICFSVSSQTDPVESVFWDLFNNSQFEEASDYIENAIDTYPDNKKYFFLRANVNIKIKKPELALSDIENYLGVYPVTTDVCILEGEAYIQMMDYEKAIIALYKGIDLVKFDVIKQYCLLKMGEVYVLQKKYKMGYEKLLDAQDFYSDDVEYLHYIGVAQINMGLLDEAELTKKTLLELYPHEAHTYSFLVEYYQKKGDYVEALKYLDNKLSMESGTEKDYVLLKKLAVINNDTLRLIRAYEEELKIGGNDYSCNLNLAKLYCSTKEYSKALLYVNNAISINENAPACYKTKGDIYLKLNLKAQGCDCYFLGLKRGYDTSDGKKLLQTYVQSCEK